MGSRVYQAYKIYSPLHKGNDKDDENKRERP